MGHRGSSSDDLAVATITGVVSRYAASRQGEFSDAVAAVREVAGGRADLLGVVAGTFRGRYRADPQDAWWAPDAERLCVQAGADVEVARAEADIVERRLRSARFGPASDPAAHSTGT
ncbi:hypothetical protein V6N00_13565 [Tersicoccus sp. MR15.9]|uniref:hypothetical protein n=1 Tax=Tersicoccus mangrovi TaxID=3121635 RepID=UPI002FE5D0EA